jgi:hypothetical protein
MRIFHNIRESFWPLLELQPIIKQQVPITAKFSHPTTIQDITKFRLVKDS